MSFSLGAPFTGCKPAKGQDHCLALLFSSRATATQGRLSACRCQATGVGLTRENGQEGKGGELRGGGRAVQTALPCHPPALTSTMLIR